MHCCNINKSRRGGFFLVHLVDKNGTWRSFWVDSTPNLADIHKALIPTVLCKRVRNNFVLNKQSKPSTDSAKIYSTRVTWS